MKIQICIASKGDQGLSVALEGLAEIYLKLCQDYINLFCTDVAPDQFTAPVIFSTLPQRWQRAAIRQTYYIARGWHLEKTKKRFAIATTTTNLASKSNDDGSDNIIPKLQQTVIYANCNVVKLTEVVRVIKKEMEAKEHGFDYWLTISTMKADKTIRLPIVLSDQNKAQVIDKKLKSGTVLFRDDEGQWWLTLEFKTRKEVIT